MNKTYDPDVVEKNKKNLNIIPKRNSELWYRMILPPPNVTGRLHLGHALTNAIQDCLVRYKSMNNYNIEWIPGTDHAGIATQSVTTRHLISQGIDPNSLSREEFIKKIWYWKESYGDIIYDQLRQYGCLLDWKNTQFTMSSALSKGVVKAFITLYNRGLIYRDKRIINWCVILNTSISDIEVDTMEIDKPTNIQLPEYEKKISFGWMYNIYYQVEGMDDKLLVSTTRPETIFGDVALAIHSSDIRYKAYHNKNVIHPFTKKPIPIIIDDILVNPEFGSGVVKITPAHDKNDFECGQRHKLPVINIINKDGTLNEKCGECTDLPRFTARFKVLRLLSDMSLFKDKVPYKMKLKFCSRSGTLIESIIKPQWFINCKGMAKRAIDVVENKEMIIRPEYHAKIWNNWLRDPHPWCISRQLVWGHRIPAYHVKSQSNGIDKWEVTDSINTLEEKYKDVDDITIDQDPDVLDTWFSSGIYPFTIYEENGRKSHQLDMLETGKDILFFWVARMTMLSLELRNRIPFFQVYLHNMVRDRDGRKMSKSLGNVIDPFDIMRGINQKHMIDRLTTGNLDKNEVKKAIKYIKKTYPNGIPKYGTDALRFGLLQFVGQNTDINLDLDIIKRKRFFCNKIWQSIKFILPYLEQDFKFQDITTFNMKQLNVPHKKILLELNECIDYIHNEINEIKLGDCVIYLTKFWFEKLCNTYLEYAKKTFFNDDLNEKYISKNVLYYCILNSLKILHPFMPFITDYLYQILKVFDINIKHESIIEALYPLKIKIT